MHLKTLRREDHPHAVYALAVGPDGRIYSGSGSGSSHTIHVWSGDDGQLLHVLYVHGRFYALATTRDGVLLSAGTEIQKLEDDQSVDSEDSELCDNEYAVLMW